MTENPTYSDYVNVDELYDVEEIKEQYLTSAHKRGWGIKGEING